MDCRFKRYMCPMETQTGWSPFLVRIVVPIASVLIHRLLDHSNWSKYNGRRFNPLSFYSFLIHL